MRPEEGDPASDEESADAGVQLLVVREQPFGDEGNRANRELKIRRFMRECNCWWTNFKHVESQFFVRKNFVAGKNRCQVFIWTKCVVRILYVLQLNSTIQSYFLSFSFLTIPCVIYTYVYV